MENFKMVTLNDDNELVFDKQFLEIEDWEAEEAISLDYDEISDRLILRNLERISNLKENGTVSLPQELTDTASLPGGTLFDAEYSEETDCISLSVSGYIET